MGSTSAPAREDKSRATGPSPRGEDPKTGPILHHSPWPSATATWQLPGGPPVHATTYYTQFGSCNSWHTDGTPTQWTTQGQRYDTAPILNSAPLLDASTAWHSSGYSTWQLRMGAPWHSPTQLPMEADVAWTRQYPQLAPPGVSWVHGQEVHGHPRRQNQGSRQGLESSFSLGAVPKGYKAAGILPFVVCQHGQVLLLMQMEPRTKSKKGKGKGGVAGDARKPRTSTKGEEYTGLKSRAETGQRLQANDAGRDRGHGAVAKSQERCVEKPNACSAFAPDRVCPGSPSSSTEPNCAPAEAGQRGDLPKMKQSAPALELTAITKKLSAVALFGSGDGIPCGKIEHGAEAVKADGPHCITDKHGAGGGQEEEWAEAVQKQECAAPVLQKALPAAAPGPAEAAPEKELPAHAHAPVETVPRTALPTNAPSPAQPARQKALLACASAPARPALHEMLLNDFGGKVEPQDKDCPAQTAAREFVEELWAGQEDLDGREWAPRIAAVRSVVAACPVVWRPASKYAVYFCPLVGILAHASAAEGTQGGSTANGRRDGSLLQGPCICGYFAQTPTGFLGISAGPTCRKCLLGMILSQVRNSTPEGIHVAASRWPMQRPTAGEEALAEETGAPGAAAQNPLPANTNGGVCSNSCSQAAVEHMPEGSDSYPSVCSLRVTSTPQAHGHPPTGSTQPSLPPSHAPDRRRSPFTNSASPRSQAQGQCYSPCTQPSSSCGQGHEECKSSCKQPASTFGEAFDDSASGESGGTEFPSVADPAGTHPSGLHISEEQAVCAHCSAVLGSSECELMRKGVQVGWVRGVAVGEQLLQHSARMQAPVAPTPKPCESSDGQKGFREGQRGLAQQDQQQQPQQQQQQHRRRRRRQQQQQPQQQQQQQVQKQQQEQLAQQMHEQQQQEEDEEQYQQLPHDHQPRGQDQARNESQYQPLEPASSAQMQGQTQGQLQGQMQGQDTMQQQSAAPVQQLEDFQHRAGVIQLAGRDPQAVLQEFGCSSGGPECSPGMPGGSPVILNSILGMPRCDPYTPGRSPNMPKGSPGMRVARRKVAASAGVQLHWRLLAKMDGDQGRQPKEDPLASLILGLF